MRIIKGKEKRKIIRLQGHHDNDMTADGKSLLWLSGLPGAGKSCVANTLVKRLVERGRKVIYFKFDRSSRADATAKVLWRSVAYQLADQFVEPRQVILKELQDDPSLSNLELLTSGDIFEKLIVKALVSIDNVPSALSPAVIINALDECGGDLHSSPERWREDVLLIIKKWTALLPHCKLVVTSRAESDIERVLSQISRQVVLRAGDEVDEDSLEDVRRYIQLRLQALADRRALPGWPKPKHVRQLGNRASGLFIWAKTACDYIELGVPSARMSDLLASSPTKVADMQGLYSKMMDQAFSSFDNSELRALQIMTGTIVALSRPLSLEAMTALINAGESEVVLTNDYAAHIRTSLRSVLIGDEALQFGHLSFPEYLQSSGCPEKYRIDTKVEHRRLTLSALKMMSQLRFNICELETSHVLNEDDPELSRHVEAKLSPGLSYVCQFWTVHLLQTTYDSHLSEAAWDFLHRRALFWLEAMSLIKSAGKASQMLASLASWVSVCLVL
jgi:hypothetical protein